jgi:hypothetical protein
MGQSRQAIIFRLAALFLAVSLNHLASTETYIRPGRSCPAPQLKTAGEMLLAVLYECSDYQSFSLAGSSRYVGSFTFRDQLGWPGAARVLAATNFRRSECANKCPGLSASR